MKGQSSYFLMAGDDGEILAGASHHHAPKSSSYNSLP